MRIKLIFISLIIFALTFAFLYSSPKIAFADNFTLSGSVKDASGNAISDSTVSVNDTNNDSTTTDNSGNYSLSIPQGTYNVQVTPPAGSNFSSTIALSQNISANTVLNFLLVASGQVRVSGHVRDSLGNAVAGQTVKLIASGGSTASTTSEASGNYILTVSPATYQSLVVTADHNVASLNVPQHYQLISSNFSLTQSTIVDFVIPAKKVGLHVQDASGNSVGGVTIKASLTGGLTQNLSIGGNITAAGESSYGVTGTTTAITDSSGNTTLWLTPTGSNTSYTFVATPPSGSNQVTTTVSNVTFTNDTQQTITLPQPVTLSGRVYDPFGNPVSGQTVQLIASGGGGTFSTTSNASGIYSFTVAPGTYQAFVITADNNSSSVNLSQHYKLIVSNYSLTQNTTADITVPVKKVTIHIQDAAGNSVSNVSVKATIPNGLIQNLSIGSSITAAGESSYGVTATSPKTDSSGNIILWLLPTGANTVYNITATPPSGSGFQTTTLSNVTFNSDTQETITLQQPVTLSGHVYDSLGNPLASQTVTLISSGGSRFTAITNTSGVYSLNVSAATYQTFLITADNNSFSLNAPQHYQLIASNYSLTQNTTADITVPAKKVTVHVQDQQGNPVSSIGIKALITNGLAQGLSIGSNITAAGESSYGVTGASPQTDSSGNVIMWLLPNDSNSPYAFTATPPNGSIYSTFTLSSITVSGDQTELISLQYSHNPPTTTATLSPAPDIQNNYSDPTTVTLSATATSGYTVANTYYTVDGGSQQTYSSPFTVAGNGNHTITYWSVDNTGVQETHNTKSFTIHMNQSPHINTLSDSSINLGDTYKENSSFTDPDSSSWTATVDYGDGAGSVNLSLNSDKTFFLSHQYTTVGTYTVTVVVTDDQGATGTTLASVTVNAPPKITGLNDTSINYQDDFIENGSFTDPDSGSWTGTVDYGFGAGEQSLTLNADKTFTLDYPYPAVGVYTVTVRVKDNQGAVGAKSISVKVNAPPHINQLLGATINEGQAYTENGLFGDGDSDTWTTTVDYGDGSPVDGLTLNSDKTFSLNHIYKDNGIYTATVKVTDNQGATGTQTGLVTVKNVAPKIGTITIPTDPIVVNTPITASAPFTDPGVLDTHTATWNWGDYSPHQTGTVTESNGSGIVSNSHVYTQSGVYTITLTLTDKDGGADTRTTTSYVVVYDSTGGFITGSGHLESPIGAYPTNSEASGEVKFGINAKYKDSTPEGKTKFNFKEANLNFESTSYQWYVIIGNKAQLKGTGVINGSGNYNFLLTAIDTGKPEGERTDTLRMKITDTNGSIIYDNQPGTPDTADPIAPLQNGSIKIHN